MQLNIAYAAKHCFMLNIAFVTKHRLCSKTSLMQLNIIYASKHLLCSQTPHSLPDIVYATKHYIKSVSAAKRRKAAQALASPKRTSWVRVLVTPFDLPLHMNTNNRLLLCLYIDS